MLQTGIEWMCNWNVEWEKPDWQSITTLAWYDDFLQGQTQLQSGNNSYI